MSQAFDIICPHCASLIAAAYADHPVQDLVCPHCARAVCLFVRKQRFEVLFDLATGALLAGYAREAVGSFAAALERSFEFYVRAFALEQAAAGETALDEAAAQLEQTWRLVDRQSERQVGMLALAYLLREGRPPDFLKPQTLGSQFRNAVIHRGHLPAAEEVQAYASQVFGIIDGLLGDLGEATLQVQALDDLNFQRHFAGLPAGTPAVIEEHPGVFRARMFGRFHGGAAQWLAGTKSHVELAAPLCAPANHTPSEVYTAALAYFSGAGTKASCADR